MLTTAGPFHCPQNNIHTRCASLGRLCSRLRSDVYASEGWHGFTEPGPASQASRQLFPLGSPSSHPQACPCHCLAESYSPFRHLQGSFSWPLRMGLALQLHLRTRNHPASPPRNDHRGNNCLKPTSLCRLSLSRKEGLYLSRHC